MRGCDCPLPTTLPDIPNSNCPFDINQIQKVVFQQDGYVFDAGSLLLAATVSALKTADDATKIVTTPFITGNPIVTPGGAITRGGGDNNTKNGIEIITGRNPSIFSCEFDSLSPDQERALKSVGCNTNLRAFFINEENKIIATQDGLTQAQKDAGSHIGFPISALFIDDREVLGFGANDMSKMRFSLVPGWSSDIVKVTPTDYNALTDL